MVNYSNKWSTGIVDMDAVDLSRAIRSRQVSCREVMEAFLAQIDRLNPAVNAIVSPPRKDRLAASGG